MFGYQTSRLAHILFQVIVEYVSLVFLHPRPHFSQKETSKVNCAGFARGFARNYLTQGTRQTAPRAFDLACPYRLCSISAQGRFFIEGACIVSVPTSSELHLSYEYADHVAISASRQAKP